MILLALIYILPGAVMLCLFAPGSYSNLRERFGEVEPWKFVASQVVAMLSWPVIVFMAWRGR